MRKLRIKGMMRGGLITITSLLVCFFAINALPSFAQNSPKNLVLIYTNNIGAEIDPCPV